MLKPQIPVAKEGYPFIGYAVFITLIFALFGQSFLTVIALICSTFIICFFRDPERFVPQNENAIVSPADGKIILIENVTDDRFTEGEALKVSIFMNVFNVHVNRVPFNGTVEKIIYVPGKFYSADSKNAELKNEYCATILTTDNGKKLAYVQIAGLIARRIICWHEKGDIAVKGRRFGLIRFGSRVDLFLPPETSLIVERGQKVSAGETTIGYLEYTIR